MAKEKLVQLNVRIPEKTVEAVREMADKEDRSLAKQVAHILKLAASPK